MNYKHTQIWYLTMYIFIILTIYFWTLTYLIGINREIIIILVIIVFILTSFLSLTVSINKNKLKVRFGYEIFQKTFQVDHIISVKIVKNHWYYGWGIRVWFWPYMWIYNISWFDAVEIIMQNGDIYRIWTDEAEKLEEAILGKIENNLESVSTDSNCHRF